MAVFRTGLASWICLAVTAIATAAEFHVAPIGSPKGDGSAEQPWDLATALAGAEIVRPGDTVWLHAGTYRGGFVSSLKGAPDKPIVVRGARGERVTIDTLHRDERDNGLFLLGGADTIYRDFEVTCSHPTRETKLGGSWPEDIRRGGVDIRGDRIAAVNLVVHDCGGGFGFWAQGEGGEISGCVIYYNGWKGPDRGHGHGIYAQNARGTKRIADNIVFHQFAYGIHAYGSEKAALKGFDIEGNICFDNGCLTRKGDNAPGIMVGGATPAERIAVKDNVIVAGGIRLGYPWGVASEDVICTGNYADQGLIVRDFRRATVTGNTLAASSNVVSLEGEGPLLLAGLAWNKNDYYVTDGRWGECSLVEHNKSRGGLPFDQWQKITGCDADSTFTKGAPQSLRVVVRPNAHEPGRANIAILNPAGLPEVEVDLSGVLKSGSKFRIASAKDFYGPALVEGTYEGGAIRVPMKAVKPAQPVGMPAAELPATEPHFGAFVVLPE
jgi:hypothetical protein